MQGKLLELSLASIAEIDGGRIPESFKVSVPVWRNPGLRHITATVELGLFLDLDTPAIEIRLLSDEIAQAEFSASEELRVVLNRLLVAPLFQGSPGSPSVAPLCQGSPGRPS